MKFVLLSPNHSCVHFIRRNFKNMISNKQLDRSVVSANSAKTHISHFCTKESQYHIWGVPIFLGSIFSILQSLSCNFFPRTYNRRKKIFRSKWTNYSKLPTYLHSVFRSMKTDNLKVFKTQGELNY